MTRDYLRFLVEGTKFTGEQIRHNCSNRRRFAPHGRADPETKKPRVLSPRSRKTRAFVESGHLDRDDLKFQRDRVTSIAEAAPRDASVVSEKLEHDYPALYREHAFSDPKTLKKRHSTMLEETAFDGLTSSSD
jgi:hypothetical protein